MRFHVVGFEKTSQNSIVNSFSELPETLYSLFSIGFIQSTIVEARTHQLDTPLSWRWSLGGRTTKRFNNRKQTETASNEALFGSLVREIDFYVLNN